MSLRPFLVLSTLLMGVLSQACGILPAGSATGTDPIPNGTVIKRGNFSGLNGRTVTGSVSIFQLASNGTHVIRLEGISVPQEGPFLVVGTSSSSATLYAAQLRFTSGNQNYYTTVQSPTTWDSIWIRSSTNGLLPDYGKAVLFSP